MQCVACSNKASNKKDGISFHVFPKEQYLREKWESLIPLEGWKATNSSKLCSIHFTQDDFERSSPFRVYLKKGAIPCKFDVAYLNKKAKKSKNFKQTNTDTKKNEHSTNNGTNQKAQDLIDLVANADESDVNPQPKVVNPINQVHCDTVQPEIVVDKEIGKNSTENYNNKCTIKVADYANLKKINDLSSKLSSKEDQLRNARKTIKILHQSKRRLQKRVTSLKSVVKSLNERNCVQDEFCHLLKDTTNPATRLLQRQADKVENPQTKKVYDEGVRSFAISLNFISPKAYKYVRNTFKSCLPHPRTLLRWYETINGNSELNNGKREFSINKSSTLWRAS
ncbi:PREDICTED: THAP domain-containing protein 1-like [Nicrophorus vespilloides]|uniref:THAP domain-containing protein 1-like n=1 Tax=Nicrophorus vespilloides TaxID=110193 RepID=A0ABM1M396_NICVS|nr:PREDICTED: THAP domain-containing protein 1-like [Nicrophorus vespilloides]